MLLALVGYERLLHRPLEGSALLLPGFVAADVDSVQVLPPDAPEDKVSRALETHVSKCPTAQSLLGAVEITWEVAFQ